jgi:hypothetical protein
VYEELVEQVRQGDAEAFDTLARMVGDRCLAIAVWKTTVSGEQAGGWSAVIVKDGTPQRIAVWLSDDKVAGIDCRDWVASIGASIIADSMGPEAVQPMGSGAFVTSFSRAWHTFGGDQLLSPP